MILKRGNTSFYTELANTEFVGRLLFLILSLFVLFFNCFVKLKEKLYRKNNRIK